MIHSNFFSPFSRPPTLALLYFRVPPKKERLIADDLNRKWLIPVPIWQIPVHIFYSFRVKIKSYQKEILESEEKEGYQEEEEGMKHGCHRSGNSQGQIKFFKVREESGYFILSQEKLKFWRKVRENWNCWFNIIEGWKKQSRSVWSEQCFSLMRKANCHCQDKKDGCNCCWRPLLYLRFCIYLVREILFLSGKSQGISRSCGRDNHGKLDLFILFSNLLIFLFIHISITMYLVSHHLDFPLTK